MIWLTLVSTTQSLCSVAKMLCIFIRFALIFQLVLHINANNSTENALNREHKIHNIVLYPDKHSWCKATSIVQVISHPGCEPIKMDNNVCVGACFSYIVPRTVPETPGDVSPYCDSCQPGHVTWKKVTLECVEGTYKNQNLTKWVEHINDCNCASCDLNSRNLPKEEDIEEKDNDLDESLISDYSSNLASPLEVNQMSPNASESGFKTVISGILNTLSNDNESILENDESKGLHRNVWKSLLEKVEISNSSLDTDVFNKLVKSVEEEMKVKFNYKRLKQALLKLKKYENITKMNMKSNSFDKSRNLIESANNKSDLFVLGVYSKISPRLHSHKLQKEESLTLDMASNLLQPTTSGSEISYRDDADAKKKVITSKVENQTTTNKPYK